ncbi:MAG: uracil-DNA glycosylase family protein [Anaeromassilibacillus sp.]
MPSPKSRAVGFYYSHPQNRFWRVLADVFQQALPVSKEEKVAFCLRNHIALWDVLRSCAIEGADDGSIREPVTNDLPALLQKTHIHTICTTGTKAAALYKRLCLPSTRLPAVHFHPPARRIAATIHTRGLLRHTLFYRGCVPKIRD